MSNRFRASALVSVALCLAACGGGGGGGGGPGGGGVGGLPTSSAAGRIIFDRGRLGALTEIEPNDSVSRPHPLGGLYAAQDVRVLGTAAAATDPFDGYSIAFPVRLHVTVSLTVTDPVAGTLALSLFDPISLQFLGDAAGTGSVKSFDFYAKGTFDLVVRALAGASDYSLSVHADNVTVPIVPAADATGVAELIGEVQPGDTVSYRSTLSNPTDTTDEVLIPCPAAAKLTFTATYPAFQDFDLEVFDATTNLAAPTILQSFATPTLNPEGGSITVSAGKLLAVRIRTSTGVGTYTLTVKGDPVGTLVAAARFAPLLAVTPARNEALRLAATTPGAPAYGRAEVEVAPREALVAFDDADAARATFDIEARGGRIIEVLSDGVRRVELPIRTDLDADEAGRVQVSRIRGLSTSRVRYAEANSIHHVAATTPNDTYFSLQWDMKQLNLPKAWDVTTGSANIIVAVIDTGVRQHPDLASRLMTGYDFVSDASNSNDGDGRDSDPTDPGDSGSSFHGTHVAGTIGALTNNGSGVAGVTWATRIMPLRALGYNGGSDSDVVEAIRYAAKLSNASGTLPATRANVINMSLGGGSYSTTFQNAVSAANAAGVTIIAAAGNSNTSAPSYPAAYSGVISVMALDYNKGRAPYSNYGTTVDVAAPGGDMSVDRNADGYSDGVLSTRYSVSGSTYTPNYDFLEGTSMACPHVAGIAALVLAIDPTLTPSQVETVLESTAQDLGTAGKDSVYGYGLIDAYAAVVAAASVNTPPPPPPPAAPPLISVSPPSLNFDAIFSFDDITVSNSGGGTVVLGAISVTTKSGGPWLSIQGLSGPDFGVDHRVIHVGVDRTGLPAGDYRGTITIPSSGGTAKVEVYASVLAVPPPPPNVDIHVRARRADTGIVAQEIVVNPSATLTWSFPTLPTGNYYFEASSDFDLDGVFCEDGDYCGAFPIESQSTVVEVIAGIPVTGIDFRVSLKRVLGVSSAPR